MLKQDRKVEVTLGFMIIVLFVLAFLGLTQVYDIIVYLVG